MSGHHHHGSRQYKEQQLAALRTEFQKVWTAADRHWADQRDTCLCAKPRPGYPTMNVTHCMRCQRVIR